MGSLMLKLEEIKELLEIDLTSPTALRWKVNRANNRIKAGDIAGCLNKLTGYYSVRIDRKDYKNHRIIYALYHNLELDQLPEYLDHIDRNPSNNNPLNLRPATMSQNQGNVGLSKSNTSGVKGVSWHKPCQNWRAVIMMNGKYKHLGFFGSIEEAKKAYEEASRSYLGEFSNTDC